MEAILKQGRKWTVETHPKKEQIINAIVKGEKSLRGIAGQYDLPKSTVISYVKAKLSPQAAEAVALNNLKTGQDIINELQRVMGMMYKLYAACDEYLQDPENPAKYCLGPRGTDIDIVYDTEDGRRKETLQDVLDRLAGKGVQTLAVSQKTTDPRRLMIDTSAVLTKQIELIGRILGEVKDVQVNLTLAEAWTMVKVVIVRVLKKHPDAMKDVVSELGTLDIGPEGN